MLLSKETQRALINAYANKKPRKSPRLPNKAYWDRLWANRRSFDEGGAPSEPAVLWPDGTYSILEKK